MMDENIWTTFYGMITDTKPNDDGSVVLTLKVKSYVSSERPINVMKVDFNTLITELVEDNIGFCIGDGAGFSYDMKIVNGKPELVLESLIKL